MSADLRLVEASDAARMLRLYDGNGRHHYTCTIAAPASRGLKQKADYRWMGSAPTEAAMEAHLAGRVGLVVVPIRDDGTATFGTIDIDDYDVNLRALVRRAEALPCMVTETKSGGAHIDFFFSEPIPAAQLRRGLPKLAKQLGLAKYEIFPKQDQIARDEEGRTACGNGINLPYFGGTRSAQTKKGGELTLSLFLREAEARRLSVEAFDELCEGAGETEDETLSPEQCAEHARKMLLRHERELGAKTIKRNEALSGSARYLGSLVGAGWVPQGEVEEALWRACEANGLAREEGDKTRDTIQRRVRVGKNTPHPPLPASAAATEDSVALDFAERYADDFRFDHDVGAWFRWTGSHWAKESTRLAFHLARELAREISARQTKSRSQLAKVAFASGVERFSQADRHFAVTQEIWDPDPLLLGTPEGAVDLRTGELRTARPDDFITKIAAVAPGGECPRWMQFLTEASQGDDELIDFLHRICGYALTGIIREHILVFVHGAGGNGKSVFVNTISGILGDYATVAPMETFTASRYSQHPTDLAMLRGARLVTAAETEEGRAWAETRIKQMTGGDPISARFMRRDFFTYQPQFKLLIYGNDAPTLNNVSDAMRRRLAIVPFTNKPARPDPELEKTLREEWPGILRWMIEGCLAWQRDDLPRPGIVDAATADYFGDQDLFGQWLAQSVTEPPFGVRGALSRALFESWSAFAIASGEEAGTIKSFGMRMTDRGFGKAQNGKGELLRVGAWVKPEPHLRP